MSEYGIFETAVGEPLKLVVRGYRDLHFAEMEALEYARKDVKKIYLVIAIGAVATMLSDEDSGEEGY